MPKRQDLRIVDSRATAASGGSTVLIAGHTHDSRYSQIGHAHDDRYYTESETDALLAGYVLKSTFDANTILIANDDNTPVALSVGASTLVGRAASGGIAALNASSARTVLGLATTDAPTFAGVIASYIAPASDGATAFQVRKADKTTAVLTIDTTNSRIGISAAPGTQKFVIADNTQINVLIDVASSEYYYYRPTIFFNRARGTQSAKQSTQAGDWLGTFEFRGAYGNVNTTYAAAAFTVVQTDTATSATTISGSLVFMTNPGTGGNYVERLIIDKNGLIGIGTTSPSISDGVGVDINGKILRLRSSKTPASASATGNVGEICWDGSYLYICTASNTWRRVAHSSW